MSNGNGTVKTISFFLYAIGGFIGISLAINTLVYVPLQKANADEVKAREYGDRELRLEQVTLGKDVDIKMEKIQSISQKNSIMLARIAERLGVGERPD